MKNFLIKKIKSWFFFEVWNVKIVKSDIEDGFEFNFDGLLLPIRSKIEFNADPFIVERDNKLFVFVEKYSYLNKIGYIYCYVLNQNLKIIDEFSVIKEKYHLSYPQVFEYENCFYMIPESSQISQTWLYKASEFPYKWEKVLMLFDNQKIVDSSIFFYNKKWWLFYSKLLPNKNNICEFHIAYSDNPINDSWNYHRKNPIYINNTKSRMAGQVINIDHRLFRPTQYCKNSYGEKIDLYQIETLNEENFVENYVSSIVSKELDYNKGCHHISYSKNFIAIDCKKFTFCWYKILIRFLRKFVKIKIKFIS
jgi:hypothetical protein